MEAVSSRLSKAVKSRNEFSEFTTKIPGRPRYMLIYNNSLLRGLFIAMQRAAYVAIAASCEGHMGRRPTCAKIGAFGFLVCLLFRPY